MILTLRQAAELTGKSKSTLARAIKSGRLSASRDSDGMYAIDPAELARAYPFAGQNAQRDGNHGASRNSQEEPDDTALLRLRLSMLTEERERERTAAEREREQLTATITDLRMRLDRAEQRGTLLLKETSQKRRPWWPWG